VGPLDAPLLIVAEGGTFVDQIGQIVHQTSGRAGGAFVVADCGSVRPERSEAALFGEEGGDAGAHPGWLRLAAGGSLLLVDAPALSPVAQHTLAEAVAARQARPVGGAGSYPLDARIIATSRLDLDPLVDAGAFDPELGRWLSPLRVEVPPLRERREDLPSLVLLALDRACRVLGRTVVGIEPEALEVLLAHDWPGNLRELQSVIDRAVARTEGSKVSRKDLPPLPRGMATAEGVERDDDPLVGTYTALEKRILERALERAAGNKSEAARLLGLKRTTFLDKLRRHRIDDAA
jgi:DNA-binding NtrC family response regulator